MNKPPAAAAVGRPPLPTEHRRSKSIQLRVSPTERQLLEETAEQAGITAADVLRRQGIPYPPGYDIPPPRKRRTDTTR